MIYLVLEANREHALGLHLDFLAITVQKRRANMFGAFDGFVKTGNRQTTLVCYQYAIFFQDLRIDECVWLSLIIRYIGDQQTAMNINLGRRESDSRRVIHCLEHVVDQRAQRIVNRLNRARLFPEPGIRKLQNRKFCHNIAMVYSARVGGKYFSADIIIQSISRVKLYKNDLND